MRTARLLIDLLREKGVSRIYGIPGEENLDIMEEISSAGFDFVLTRHEQAAAFMAATEGRLSGRPGVCLSTLGPGATNLVTGVADAYLSNVPMIALVGQAGMARRNPPQKQVLDLMSMFRPLTKKVIDIHDPKIVGQTVTEAFSFAMKERTGPVMIQVPEDVMRSPAVAQEPVSAEIGSPSIIDMDELTSIRDALLTAEAPLVIIGHGTLRADAADEARAFCKEWGLPSGCTWMAAGIVPFDDPLSLGTIGMRSADLVKEAYSEADLIVLLGYDVTEFQPKFWNVGREKRIVFIGESGPCSSKDLMVSSTVIGDMGLALRDLTQGAVPKKDWARRHREHLRNDVAVPTTGAKGLVQALRRQMGRDDILISDVGAHLIWLAKFYPAYSENTLLLQNGLISMGVAVPSAIAAKIMRPDRKVVAVVGDGGFLMSSSELETAKRRDVNFVTVIFNDGGLGLIREKMRRGYGHSSNVDLGMPDIPQYARSFGAEGYSVDEAGFEDVLKDCLRRDALAVIEVKVDYSDIGMLF